MTNLQAINLLKGLEQSLDDYCELNDEGKTAFRMAIAALELFGNAEQLPSAQPDIVRCEYCKYQDKGENDCESWNLCGYRPWLYVPVTDDHYCGWAKRKEAET